MVTAIVSRNGYLTDLDVEPRIDYCLALRVCSYPTRPIAIAEACVAALLLACDGKDLSWYVDSWFQSRSWHWYSASR